MNVCFGTDCQSQLPPISLIDYDRQVDSDREVDFQRENRHLQLSFGKLASRASAAGGVDMCLFGTSYALRVSKMAKGDRNGVELKSEFQLVFSCFESNGIFTITLQTLSR